MSGWSSRCFFALILVICMSWCGCERPDQTARMILENTGITGGLIVHVGCGNGHLTTALRAGDGYLVQGISTDENDVRETREYAGKLGLLGSVNARLFDGVHLPYTDGVVNLLVISDEYDISGDEIMRVLAPLGVAYIHQRSGWREIVKHWPDEIDEWTHYLHDFDNNAVARDALVGPPRHMQWVAGPTWTRNHHKLNSISSVVTSKGRLFYIMDESPAANINLPGRWSIVARDAFNGVELWRKPMESWTWHLLRFRSGPPQVTRLLIARGDRVYAPLGLNAPISVMDASNGQTIATYADTSGAEEIILVRDTLLVMKGAPVAEHADKHPKFADIFQMPNRKSILAFDLIGEKPIWEWSDPELSLMPETLASDGKRVFVQAGNGVIALDIATGDRLWDAGDIGVKRNRAQTTYGQYTLVVSDGVVLCKLLNKLVAFSAENGAKLWDCPADGGFHSPLDVFVINGIVWQGSHVSDSVAPPAINDFNIGRDLHTGEIRRTNMIMADLQTAGHHHRCYREKATTRYIMTGKRGIEFLDLIGDDHSRNNWVRGSCQYGILPANGLIYAPPHSCGCYMESKLWGFWALSAQKSRPPKLPQSRRLVRGEAYGSKPDPAGESDQDWPQFRHDPLRSGVATTSVPAQMEQLWMTKIGGRLSQPVIADGKLLVSSVDENTVYALNEKTGEVEWRFITGGRVDSPPAVYRGLVIFGSADGWVYCLTLEDGDLVWRFLAAPADVNSVAFDQVESVWRVHGSVLVLNGIVYCSAGRSTWLDGGIDLYGLDPTTGEVIHQTHFESKHPKFENGIGETKPEYMKRIGQNVTDAKTFLAPDLSDAFSMAGGSVSDVLVSNGRDVFMHHVRFDSELNRQNVMARHLFSTSSLLDDAENHRSHWVLGTGDFSRIPVAYSWIVNKPKRKGVTIAVPTGIMMVYDDQNIWGVRRKGDSNGKYVLFRKGNTPFSEDEMFQPDFRELEPEQVDPSIWMNDLPVRARAMVKSGDYLFIGVVPIDVPKDDPYAAYENRTGGKIWVISADDGRKTADYDLISPVVWDGMAAANSKLFLSLTSGSVSCWGAKK